MNKQFLSAVNSIIELDVNASRVNLVEAANADQASLEDIRSTLQKALNMLVFNKTIVLNSFNYKDLILTNKVSQSIKRHNQQVLWTTARQYFLTDGETSAFLSHITVKKGKAEFTEKSKSVKVSSFSTFSCTDNLIKFGVKNNKESLEVSVTEGGLDMPTLLRQYCQWKESLSDEIPVIEATAETRPADTLETKREPTALEINAERFQAERNEAIVQRNTLADRVEELETANAALAAERDALLNQLAALKAAAAKPRRRARKAA